MSTSPTPCDDTRNHEAGVETRAAWNANAAFWDERMGDEGNDFVNVLIWPATLRLLQPRADERILDVACGNGLYARRLAALGAQVVAFDFAEEMIGRARQYKTEHDEKIEYRTLDAGDEAALLGLGERSFDAAVCQMALMDMAEIEPLFHGLARLLKPNGRFVFAVSHPCFNRTGATHTAEMEERGGEIVTTYAVKVSRYMTRQTAPGIVARGQPQPHLYFERSLSALLAPAFGAGFVLDALEERAFPPDHRPGRNQLGWGANYSEIPPVLMARLRLV